MAKSSGLSMLISSAGKLKVAKATSKKSPKSKSKTNISLIILDVDGTLTDGKIHYLANGEEIKSFDIKDGLGLAIWNSIKHYHSAIITGRISPIVEKRAKELGIKHIYMGIKDKGKVVAEILTKLKLTTEEVACIGDDVNDIPMFSACEHTYAPNNAVEVIRNMAKTTLRQNGGDGAVREMIEDILDKNGQKDAISRYYQK